MNRPVKLISFLIFTSLVFLSPLTLSGEDSISQSEVDAKNKLFIEKVKEGKLRKKASQLRRERCDKQAKEFANDEEQYWQVYKACRREYSIDKLMTEIKQEEQ